MPRRNRLTDSHSSAPQGSPDNPIALPDASRAGGRSSHPRPRDIVRDRSESQAQQVGIQEHIDGMLQRRNQKEDSGKVTVDAEMVLDHLEQIRENGDRAADEYEYMGLRLIIDAKNRKVSEERLLGSDFSTIAPGRADVINEWLNDVHRDITHLFQEGYKDDLLKYANKFIKDLIASRDNDPEGFKYMHDTIQNKFNVDNSWKPIKGMIDFFESRPKAPSLSGDQRSQAASEVDFIERSRELEKVRRMEIVKNLIEMDDDMFAGLKDIGPQNTVEQAFKTDVLTDMDIFLDEVNRAATPQSNLPLSEKNRAKGVLTGLKGTKPNLYEMFCDRLEYRLTINESFIHAKRLINEIDEINYD